MIQPTIHQFIANCNDLDKIKRYSNLLNTLVTHENYKLVYNDYDDNRKPSIDWLIQTRRTFEHFCNQDMPFTKEYLDLVTKIPTLDNLVHIGGNSKCSFYLPKDNSINTDSDKVSQAKETLKNVKKLPI